LYFLANASKISGVWVTFLLLLVSFGPTSGCIVLIQFIVEIVLNFVKRRTVIGSADELSTLTIPQHPLVVQSVPAILTGNAL